eukprot:434028_1
MFRRIQNISRCALVGAFLFPHGALILDPDPNTETKSHQLHKAMKKSAETIKTLKPDLILLTSPHGILLSNSYSIYLNKYAKGSAEWLGQYSEYELNIASNPSKANSLLNSISLNLKQNNNPLSVEGLSYIYEVFSIPIRWGEVIPLWFIRDILANADNDTNTNEKQTEVIIMSSRLATPQLSTMLNMDPISIEYLNNVRYVGESIFDWCYNSDERIVVIVSGDLSHRHVCAWDQRFTSHVSAQPFDNLIEAWIKTMDSKYLNEAGLLQNSAWSCGFYGFVMLDGILQKWKRVFPDRNIRNESVCAPLHPSYYGMTVAEFVFE